MDGFRTGEYVHRGAAGSTESDFCDKQKDARDDI